MHGLCVWLRIFNSMVITILRLGCLMLSLFASALSYSQSQLDSAYVLLDHFSKGSMVAIDESDIIVIGNGTDTFTNSLGVIFSRLNLEGELLTKTFFHQQGKERFFDHLNDVCIKDSIAYTFVSGSAPEYLMKFQKYTGRLLDTIIIPDAFDPDGGVLPVSVNWIDDHRLLLCSQIYVDGVAETQVTVFDSDDNSMRHTNNRYWGYNQHVREALWIEDKIFILAYLRKESPYIASMSTIVKTDTFGEVEWRFISHEDSLRIRPNSMLATDDGGILFTQNFVKLYHDGNAYSRQLRPGFGKIGPDGQLEWEQVAGAEKYYSLNDFYDLIAASDDGGFIAVGTQANFDFADYLNGVDTLPGGRYLQNDAIICKISHEGEILWTRYYSRVENLFSDDRFKCITRHPDQGYLISGEQVQYSPGEPLVRTWLIHLDQYGCLVPGCHEIVSTAEGGTGQEPDILIYPNPTSEMLFIYQPDNKKVKYQILDMQGRLMDVFSCSTGDMTKILDVSDYPAGVYVLLKYRPSGRTQSVQWVKE